VLAYYLQLAWRSLRKTPLLSLLMVVTLAVGQAASMITLTLRHALASDPIPGKSQLLLAPRAASDGGGAYDGMFTYAQGRAMLDAMHPSLLMGQALGSVSLPDGTLSSGGQPIRFTTRNFFGFFDVPLSRGRIWSQQEDQRGDPLVVLGSDMARQLFPATDPLGASVHIGDANYRVIGVLAQWDPAPRFYDMSLGSFMHADQAFVPLVSIRSASADLGAPRICVGAASTMPPSRLLDNDCSWLTPWFLAKDTAAVPALSRHVAAAANFVLRDSMRIDFRLLDVRQILAAADVVPGSVRVFTGLGLAFLVLCIVNAAGMQLSRLLRRVAQTGIRRALGARRRDIVGQYLCETLLIGLGGGVLGAALTEAGLYWVRQLNSYYTRTASTDLATTIMTISLVAFCCLLTGMVPAWVASRADPAIAIKVQS
jgi:putative ABC transport system permease protein